MKLQVRTLIAILVSLFLAGTTISQHVLSPAEFDAIYNKGLAAISSDRSMAKLCLDSLSSSPRNSSPIQQAKINFLRLKLNYSDKNWLAGFETKVFSVPDSLGFADSLFYLARKYIERSMPDKVIPLLMKAISTLPEHSDQADRATIYLCEAYRQKQEYVKGISMLQSLLHEGSGVSDNNKAYAYNRLAALFNECGNPAINIPDSVFKYSELCIRLSEKTDNKPDLAASQNELCYQYVTKKEYDKALKLSRKSVANFRESGMPFFAMNALLNQSSAYIGMKEYEHALRSVREATNLCGIEDNRNLYMRIYNQFAWICELTGNYRDAYGFLKISHQLQLDFFKDRIDLQINEQSAKYDLLVKEQRIKEEKKRSEFRQRQIVLLVIILVVLCIAFVLSFFYLRLKKEGAHRQKLIEAMAESETNERKRIARDLHDGLGPVLSAVNHYFQAYLDAGEEDKDAIQAKLKQVISEAIDEVSRISHNISPYVLENHGLITALNNFIAALSNHETITISFVSDFNERFDLKKELTVYRCITELLNNTMKHAEATKIMLGITRKGSVLSVVYSDNGKGFDTNLSKPEGMGLYNIKNRVESFGGTLVIVSSHRKGLMATIELPI
jgi:signal transduction histidine kinase